MDSATEDLYFQKIEELIQDEDKIVRKLITSIRQMI